MKIQDLLDWADSWGIRQEMYYTLFIEYKEIDNSTQISYDKLTRILVLTMQDIAGMSWEADAKDELLTLCFGNNGASKKTQRLIKLLERLSKAVLLSLLPSTKARTAEQLSPILEKLAAVRKEELLVAIALSNHQRRYYGLYWVLEDNFLSLYYSNTLIRSIFLYPE